MTKTRRTTASWLLVALLAASHQSFVRSQLGPTTTVQAQTPQQQQQQQQQQPNMVQGALSDLSNGMPPITNSNNNNNAVPVQPLTPQQQQQIQQQQQQPLRKQANGITQQIPQVPGQANGQFSMQTNDGQPQQSGQPIMTINGQQQPNYNPQQQQPQGLQQNFQPALMPPRQNYVQQQGDQHGQPQQWKPQMTNPVPLMQQPQYQMQGQQYAQPLQQTPQRPLQMTMPVPQNNQQQYAVQQPYGGVQPVQSYQNPNPQQYQSAAGVNPNQGYVQTNTAGQQMPGNGQLLQRQQSSRSPLTAAFTMLDPTPLGRQAMDMTSSTMGSVLKVGTDIKNSVGGAAVDLTNKAVDGSESFIQGMFNLAAAVPSTLAGLKRKGINTVASMLNLPNSRQQQQQQLQQQQQQLEQLQQQQQQLLQGSYNQQPNNAQPQYGYQGSSAGGGRNIQVAGGLNPVNGPQPIVRYGS